MNKTKSIKLQVIIRVYRMHIQMFLIVLAGILGENAWKVINAQTNHISYLLSLADCLFKILILY